MGNTSSKKNPVDKPCTKCLCIIKVKDAATMTNLPPGKINRATSMQIAAKSGNIHRGRNVLEHGDYKFPN